MLQLYHKFIFILQILNISISMLLVSINIILMPTLYFDGTQKFESENTKG